MKCPYCNKEFKVVCNMADACKQCKHATPHEPDNCTQLANCYTEREDEPHCIRCEPVASEEAAQHLRYDLNSGKVRL